MNFSEVAADMSIYYLDMAGNVWNSTLAQISSGTVYKSITAGANFGCALDAAGNAYCWGNNGSGQLGSGDYVGYAAPHLVAGGKQFSSIHSGQNHTCAIEKNTNYGWCWGTNSRGELGKGDISSSSNVPVLVVDTSGNPYTFSSIYSEYNSYGMQYSCGLDLSNHAWCWGANMGTLGSGLLSYIKNPIKVGGGHVFNSIFVGGTYVCGQDSSLDLWCWGQSPGFPKFTDPPVMLSAGYKFPSISASSYNLCGIDSSGNGYCWGSNNGTGALGTGDISGYTSPHSISGGYKFSSLAPANWHGCGILASGGTSTPINYWLSTTTANHITDINKIISVGITQSTDSANAYIKWLVSFDNWATCKTWDSINSVWVAAANCSASSAANTSDDIVQGLHNYEFASGAGSLDFKAVLYNTDGVTIPDIDQVVVNYY